MQRSYEREAKIAYERALRLGKREYSSRVAQGKKGNLIALDEIVEQNKMLAYVQQPTMEIPLSSIVGTYTSGRSHSFSANFMPLHNEVSEFASKWTALCVAHVSEGLRDPIEVYEYMWQYYVVEGNKRVSVLKYYGAATFRAQITRMIPQLNEDDPNTALYYAFLRYDKNGLFKGIRMSRPENYEVLSELEKNIELSEEESSISNINKIYMQFVTALEQLQIDIPVGDVILQYLQLYGMPRGTVLSEIVEHIQDMIPQLKLISKPQVEPTLVLEQKPGTQPSLVQRLFSTRRTAKVMFAYSEGRTETNWIGAHEKGRQKMQEELQDSVKTYTLDGLNEENCYEELSKHAKDCDLVLVTSTRLMKAALRFQLENPNIMTLVYSRVREDASLSTYYGRYYEAVFLCGVAAGYASKNRCVAYITPKLSKRHTSDINAFALGVKTVSPFARVLLVSKDVVPYEPESSINGIKHAAKCGADVVMSPVATSIHLSDVPDDAFSAVVAVDEYGQPQRYIASPAWDWGRYYTEIVRSYLNQSLDFLKDINAQEVGVAGLWWGFGTGVLKLRLSQFLHPAAESLIHYLRSSIALTRFNPFHGPVKDNEGKLQIAAHSDLKPYDILSMEWIADFIELSE